MVKLLLPREKLDIFDYDATRLEAQGKTYQFNRKSYVSKKRVGSEVNRKSINRGVEEEFCSETRESIQPLYIESSPSLLLQEDGLISGSYSQMLIPLPPTTFTISRVGRVS